MRDCDTGVIVATDVTKDNETVFIRSKLSSGP